MDFLIEHPISKERLRAAARRIYRVVDSEIDVLEEFWAPLDETKKLRVIQKVALEHLCSKIIATDTENPRAAARVLAVEGGVEVLWLDDSDDSVDLEEDFYGYTLGPYILFKPDGSEHKARLPPVDIRAPPTKELWPILLD